MNQLFTSTSLVLTACLFAAMNWEASAQITYPYNPDGDASGNIAVNDLQDFLGLYGLEFTPDEILIDSIPISTYLMFLQENLIHQAQRIDSLEFLMTNPGGAQAPEQFEMLRVWDRGIEYIGQYVPNGETQQYYYPMQDSLTQRSINGWKLVAQDRIESTSYCWITGGGSPCIKAYQYNLVFSRPAGQ